MVVAQLDRLKTACSTLQGKRAYLAALLAGSTPLAADFTALSSRIVKADALKRVGSGKVGVPVR